MRTKKTLTEQIEEYFRSRQAKIWRKCKLRKEKDFLWNPPDKSLEKEEEQDNGE